MKKTTLSLGVLALLAFLCIPLFLGAQTDIKYGPDYFVFEAEDTDSPLDLWVLREPGDPLYYVGTGNEIEAINQTYIEFTGNNLNGGSPKSPLTYTFTCPKTATYRILMRMYQPLAPNEAGDKRNDVWIKLAGNYTSANVYPQSILESDHKFWGRGVRKWGTCYNLEAHVNGVKTQRAVLYNLIEGEQYTFTMSGRAQGCSIDYILFYENSLGLVVNNQDLAANNDPKYRPNAGNFLNVELDTAEIRLENIGDTYQFTATVTPDSAPDKTLNWVSDDPSIATVDANGLVTAIAEGQTFVHAIPDSAGNTASCEVNVGELPFQPITWSATQLSEEADVITDGALLEAINFAGGTDAAVYNTTLNTVAFRGVVNNRTDNVWENPATAYFSANSVQVVPETVDIYDASIGLPEFDVLLSEFLWTNGTPTTVTLSNLKIGTTYKMQLFAADTRSSQGGSYIVLADSFGDANTTPYTESNGLSIVGEFTAVAESFSFDFSKVTSAGAVQGINLNAYQLRRTATTSVETPEQSGYRIYPNPARDVLHIKSIATGTNAHITLSALDGRVVFRGLQTGGLTSLQTDQLPEGVYTLHILSGDQLHTEKVMISK